MQRVYLASYATERFRPFQEELNASANHFGIADTLSYSDTDIRDTAFYNDNQSILNEICGAGYWLWKPYIILKALNCLDEGDIVIYADSGSLLKSSPSPLIELCAKDPRGLILFDARPLTNRQFTKRDCFVRMGCDEPKYWDATKLIATILVIRNTAFTRSFVAEWLQYCTDRAALTDDASVSGRDELKGFLLHRHDQSILSVLAAKHGLETYRNPTVWGNFLKMPQFRVKDEPVASPFNLIPGIKSYARKPQSNSPYGTIFEINRLHNFEGKQTLPPKKPSTARRIVSAFRSRLGKIGQRLTGLQH